ncbi:hypothetical protein BX600DRAFT_538677 [Xylariales sp. PMI_506]|nr:hypothetical protein BX600DRAFT_538677 [Xylariales sp. PMI_506]
MRVFGDLPPALRLCALLILTSLQLATTAELGTGSCKPPTWAATTRDPSVNSGSSSTTTRVKTSSVSRPHVITDGKTIKPGDINCRWFGDTYEEVDSSTCQSLATRDRITLETFFILNPTLRKDCGNVKPNWRYCTAGFIEPLRAFDGLCGPPNNDATCVGTAAQCCNAHTFTCGESIHDCTPGSCYEGVCYGDKIYSTDGTCGYQHGNRFCAGIWGDCCNTDGKCGTGADFCGLDVCQSGRCAFFETICPAKFAPVGSQPGSALGWPADHKYCCNKQGHCGSLPVKCKPYWLA